MSFVSEGAAEALVPGLRGGDFDEHVLAVARVQVQVSEELQLGRATSSARWRASA
jgi:hypothetical protein